MGKTFVRVDDRLIHGQTIVAWVPTLKIEEIIAVDDVSASNPMLKSIMTMGVPKQYKTHIVTTAEADALLREGADVNRLLIVKVLISSWSSKMGAPVASISIWAIWPSAKIRFTRCLAQRASSI